MWASTVGIKHTRLRFETDAHRKRMLIDEAVEALQERLHSPTPLDESERSAIMNARVRLRRWKRTVENPQIL